MRIVEKHIAVEAPPEIAKLMAEALYEYSEKRALDLPKTLGDWCYNALASYQTYNELGEDDWEFTEEDKEELGLSEDYR